MSRTVNNSYSSRNMVSRSVFCSLLLLWFSLIGTIPVDAQVPGTFFPTGFGEIQEGFIPFPRAAPEDYPYLESAPLQLEQELKWLRRPYLNFISSYANQSLLTRAGQLDTFTPTLAEFGFFPNMQTEVRLFYIPTIFGLAGLKSPRVFGNEYRASIATQPTDRLKLYGELGLYQFKGNDVTKGGLEVLGAATSSYQLNDRCRLTAGYRRDLLGNTLLSATGLTLPISDKLVGRVKQNLFFLIADLRPERKTSVNLYLGGGVEEGFNILSDPFIQGSINITRPLHRGDPRSHLEVLAPSFQYLIQSWRRDQISQGNAILQVDPPSTAAGRAPLLASAALGQTQIPPPPGTDVPGVGGFFSPQVFAIYAFNLNAAGRLVGPVHWRLGGGTGVGHTKSIGTNLGHVAPGYFASARLSYRLNHRALQEHGWFFTQGTNVYRRQVWYSQTKIFF